MKDNYTLKEILLGLRGEQLRIAHQLKLLEEKLSIYGDMRHNGSYFTINSFDNICELTHQLRENYHNSMEAQNIILGRLEKIWQGPCYTCKVEKESDGNYYVGGVSIKSDEQVSFNEIADCVLHDNFVNQVSTNLRGYTNQELVENLKVFPDWLNCFYIDQENQYNCLRYKALTDSIFIRHDYYRGEYRQVIEELLSLKFPRKSFSEYLQNIIDQNDDIKKDIIVPSGEILASKAEFYLKDENDAYVLVRK